MMRYIGVTDVPNQKAALDYLECFSQLFPNPKKWKLMIGVMMSYKTLNNLPTKNRGIWPAHERLAEVFTDHKSAYNTLHYADYDGITTYSDIVRGLEQCGRNIHALQLDMILPNPKILSDIKNNYGVDIILQVNTDVFESVNNNPQKLLKMLESYKSFTNTYLLDKSGGEGKGLDQFFLEPFIRELLQNNMGIAVAGGLGPETMHRAEKILRKYPCLSVDAQGQLRESNNNRKPLTPSRVKKYFKEVKKIVIEK